MKEKVKIENQQNSWFQVALWVFVALVVGLLIGIYQYQKTTSKKIELQAEVNKKPESEIEIITAVRRLMLLSDEKPAVAIITEVDKIKPVQPFFADALDGDRILVYKDRAIIYRPQINKIINVGPISLIKSNDEIGQKLKIEIRNGSNVKGLASKLAADLSDDKTLEIIEVVNAENSNYLGNLLVNLSGKDLGDLPVRLSASTSEALPDNEATSSADILLILGN